jgi:hypothetical protein
MEVYRVEHDEKKCGPWCSSFMGEMDYLDAIQDAARRLPTPEYDGIDDPWQFKNRRFAFPIRWMIRYFFDETAIDALQDAGFVVRVYKIGDHHLQGHHQIIFDPTEAEVISEILLSNL